MEKKTIGGGSVLTSLRQVKSLLGYFRTTKREDFEIVFLGVECCSRSHADEGGKFLVFQPPIPLEGMEDDDEVLDAPLVLHFLVKEKEDGRKYVIFSPTQERTAAHLLVFETAGGLHDASRWDVEDGDYPLVYIDEETSGGGSTSKAVLLGIVPYGTKVAQQWESYKRRNGEGTEWFEATSEGLNSLGEMDGLGVDFTP